MLNVPLTLRVETSRTIRDLTGLLRDLRFRSAVPGGFASIEASFDHPLTFRPDEVSYFAKVILTDGRNGRVVWEGRLEDPERHSSVSGEIWGLTALGPSTHASDRTIPYVPVDKQAGSWTRVPGSSTFLRTSQDSQSSTTDGWRLQFDRGAVVPVADHGGIEHLLIQNAGMKLGRVAYSYVAGKTDSDWRHQIDAANGGTSTVSDVGFTTTPTGTFKIVGTDWPNGRTRAQIRLALNNTPVTVGDDVSQVWLTNLVARSMLLAPDGTDRLPTGSTTLNYAYSTDTVLAEDIVRDLLGRLLTKYDGPNAAIAASTYNIEQLAYPDGVTAAMVLDDLMMLEPNTFWAAWESLPNGKYRFVWQTWPTSVDYEASTVDGFDGPGSVVDVYNAVTVRYKGRQGAPRTLTRTQSVPVLDAAGITRTAYLDLGDEGGGAANANQVGDVFLSDHAYPPNKGTLTVARPVLSRSEGRMVAPWEIRPGRLIRVQDIEPTVDGLNATTRDGVTIFRVVSVDYDAASNSATLELDSFARSTARALAALQANPALNRRRR